jgi:hypothetical protein
MMNPMAVKQLVDQHTEDLARLRNPVRRRRIRRLSVSPRRPAGQGAARSNFLMS